MCTFFRPTILLSLPSISPAVLSSLLLVPEEDQIEASEDQDEIFTEYLSDREDSDDEDENNICFDIEEQHKPTTAAFETAAQAESTSGLETDVGEAIFQVHSLPPPSSAIVLTYQFSRCERRLDSIRRWNF